MKAKATGFWMSPSERCKARGYCTGPCDGAPAPGEVGADYMAACCTCGKRVRITAHGRYAHHRPADNTLTAVPHGKTEK